MASTGQVTWGRTPASDQEANSGCSQLSVQASRTHFAFSIIAAGLVSMEMLEQDGILKIGAVSMPGSAPVVRLMMYPDGHKLGVERIAASVENGISKLGEVLNDVDAAREKLLG